MMLSEQQVLELRKDFPILQQKVNNHALVYLDNAATTQKPRYVIDRMQQYYALENANIHRGLHHLSMLATQAYEQARTTVANFIHAKHPEEIIFVRGTTEAINLIAQSYGFSELQQGDEIIITQMEHHSNIVPWQMLCQRIGATLKVLPMNTSGELIVSALPQLISDRTKLISVIHVSNTLGSINPIAEIIAIAKKNHIPVCIDGAQAVSHLPVDVQQLDCDFYAFSGHKLFGPTGIGVLYGKKHWLEKLPPYQGGGQMIKSVSFEKTEYSDIPNKFEAGTPHIAGAIGLAAAIEYVQAIGLENIYAYEHALLHYLHESITQIPGVTVIGHAQHKTSIVSFVIKDIHAHDVGTILDADGIAIRSGHHCTMPIMDFYHIPASARASIAFYNLTQEVDVFIHGLQHVFEVFA